MLDGRAVRPQDQEMEGTEAPARADARRNRTNILLAAESAFATEGLGVPVDEIARRAGVGPGTLYRNFPTKEALYEAVIMRHMEALASEADGLATSPTPGDALFGFLRRMADEASSKRNLVEAMLGAGGTVPERLEAVKQQVAAAVAVLLERAQASGEVRRDVTVEDLFGMVIGCAMKPVTDDPRAQERMLSIVCDGLRR